MKGWWHGGDEFDQKLAHIEGELKTWRHTTFGCMRTKKRSLLARLAGIRKQYHEGNINHFLTSLEKTLQDELNDILYREELMWYQRSRTEWLHDGDRNTKYYHTKATNRKRKNRIHLLRRDNGTWLEDEVASKTHVNNFFHNLFLDNGDDSPDYSFKYSFKRLPEDVALKVGRFVENEGKAPGPDGFQAGFYHANWHLNCK